MAGSVLSFCLFPGYLNNRCCVAAKRQFLEPDAIDKLQTAVSEGERWAVELVVTFCLPKPKPADPEELEEFGHRRQELETMAKGRK